MTRANLSWDAIVKRAAGSKGLLVLRNGNVILALGRGRAGKAEILASDPLYENGEKFYLPRQSLEAAWAGDTLMIESRNLTQVVNRLLLFLSIVGIIVGGISLIDALIKLSGLIVTSSGENSELMNYRPVEVLSPAAGLPVGERNANAKELGGVIALPTGSGSKPRPDLSTSIEITAPSDRGVVETKVAEPQVVTLPPSTGPVLPKRLLAPVEPKPVLAAPERTAKADSLEAAVTNGAVPEALQPTQAPEAGSASSMERLLLVPAPLNGVC